MPLALYARGTCVLAAFTAFQLLQKATCWSAWADCYCKWPLAWWVDVGAARVKWGSKRGWKDGRVGPGKGQVLAAAASANPNPLPWLDQPSWAPMDLHHRYWYWVDPRGRHGFTQEQGNNCFLTPRRPPNSPAGYSRCWVGVAALPGGELGLGYQEIKVLCHSWE